VNSREKLIAILKENVFNYPIFPYNPPEKYPELKLLPYKIEADPVNHVYGMVRKILSMYELDDTKYGTGEWNPLSEVVSNVDGYIKIHELTREKSLKFAAPTGWKMLEVD
jgi:hypothetical protein